MKTHIIDTSFPDLKLVEIEYFQDERGFFIENWHKRDFAGAGLDVDYVQDGHSRSRQGVLRGMHYQDMTAPMGKLLRCTLGSIFDVVVDLRVGSPTFGKWYGIELTAENKKQIYIPVGFAHGFATLSDYAEVQYKQTGFYTPSSEGTLAWNDPEVAIVWPIQQPCLSKRDSHGITLRQYLNKPAFYYKN